MAAGEPWQACSWKQPGRTTGSACACATTPARLPLDAEAAPSHPSQPGPLVSQGGIGWEQVELQREPSSLSAASQLQSPCSASLDLPPAIANHLANLHDPSLSYLLFLGAEAPPLTLSSSCTQPSSQDTTTGVYCAAGSLLRKRRERTQSPATRASRQRQTQELHQLPQQQQQQQLKSTDGLMAMGLHQQGSVSSLPTAGSEAPQRQTSRDLLPQQQRVASRLHLVMEGAAGPSGGGQLQSRVSSSSQVPCGMHGQPEAELTSPMVMAALKAQREGDFSNPLAAFAPEELQALSVLLPAGARNRPSLLMQQAQHEALLAMALAADRVEPGGAQQPQAPAQGGNQQQPGGAEVEGAAAPHAQDSVSLQQRTMEGLMHRKDDEGLVQAEGSRAADLDGEHKQASSTYRGVYRRKHDVRWRAEITAGRKKRCLGSYNSEQEAAEAYDKAALTLRGPSAYTNFSASRYYANSLRHAELPAHSMGITTHQRELMGVGWDAEQRQFEARIWTRDGSEHILIGLFATPEQAAQEYDQAALDMHGTEAFTNFAIKTEPSDGLPDPSEAPQAGPERSVGTRSGGVVATATLLPKPPMGKGSSKFRGVSWHKDNLKWRATIFKGSKPVHIGYFDTQPEAARAYDQEAIRLRGPNTALNYPISDYDVQDPKNPCLKIGVDTPKPGGVVGPEQHPMQRGKKRTTSQPKHASARKVARQGPRVVQVPTLPHSVEASPPGGNMADAGLMPSPPAYRQPHSAAGYARSESESPCISPVKAPDEATQSRGSRPGSFWGPVAQSGHSAGLLSPVRGGPVQQPTSAGPALKSAEPSSLDEAKISQAEAAGLPMRLDSRLCAIFGSLTPAEGLRGFGGLGCSGSPPGVQIGDNKAEGHQRNGSRADWEAFPELSNAGGEMRGTDALLAAAAVQEGHADIVVGPPLPAWGERKSRSSPPALKLPESTAALRALRTTGGHHA